MAKAVAHTHVTYDPFAQKMIVLEYASANKKEIARQLNQLEAISPYQGKQPSQMEEGWTYFKNGLRAYIWTSYVKVVDSTRVGWDFGKVIITESNKVVYYGPEIRRTENFFNRLEHWALILKARVENRPNCKYCGRPMRIMYTEHRQYYWYCEWFYKLKDHPWYANRWDIGLRKSLPEETYQFLLDKREQTRKYNILRLKDGLPKHGTARDRKRGWEKKNGIFIPTSS